MHKLSLLRRSEKDTHQFSDDDIGHQDRLAKVLLYHSKGFSQSEIARKLYVNQSTISRDLEEIRKKARSSLELYVNDEIPNEFQIYISGINEIIKNLWQIVEDKRNLNISTRDRTYVLSLLMQCYQIFDTIQRDTLFFLNLATFQIVNMTFLILVTYQLVLNRTHFLYGTKQI